MNYEYEIVALMAANDLFLLPGRKYSKMFLSLFFF